MPKPPSSELLPPLLPKLAIEYRPLEELQSNDRNARLHTKGQIDQIAASVRTFGFVFPITCDRNRKIIAGDGRLAAAKKLGMAKVPCITIDHLTDAQIKALAIADNKLTENSVWDDGLLAEQLHELSLLDLDFSLEVTGFTSAEIDLRIDSLSDHKEETNDAADQIPAVAPAVSQLGDLWLLDNHRLFHGSALDPEAYKVLLGDQKAALVLDDPPYNVSIKNHVSGLGKLIHREFPMASGEMSPEEFTKFLVTVFCLLGANSINGSLHYHFIDWRHVGEMRAAGSVYTELKNICVWAKTTAGMGSLYRSQHEFIFVYKHGHAAHRNNVKLGRFGRHRSNLWTYPSPAHFGRSGEEGRLLDLHPTAKPVRMIADAILDASRRGDVVLDVFLGSGTTLMAAQRTGRHCYAMELDPLYVDTAVRRWQQFTGGQATHAISCKTFDEIEEERAPS